jgi:glycosyltransferase involved in cell wall biosynthesis
MSRGGISIIAGGTVDESLRRSVAEHRRPRIDVLEMEARYGARIYDFGGLQRTAAHEIRAKAALKLAEDARQWSLALALDVVPRVRDDDVVYATGEDVGFPLAAVMRRDRTRPRLVVRLESPNYGRTALRTAVFDLFRHRALERIDTLVCRTSAVLQYLHDVHRVPIDKLALLGETVDAEFWAPSECQHGPDLASLELAGGPFILSAGLEKRDYSTLIAAMRGLPLNLIIAAGSPWSHTRFGEREAEALPPNVRVASFDARQLRDLYRAAAFVVVPLRPTLRLCGGNVVLEAWAMGKAVIATRTAGILDFIEDEKNGLFVQPYDVQSWRTRITQLLEDEAMSERLGRNGRKIVETERNLDSYLSGLGRVFAGALE